MSKKEYAPCFDCQTKLRPPYKYLVLRTAEALANGLTDTNRPPLCTTCYNKRTKVSSSE